MSLDHELAVKVAKLETQMESVIDTLDDQSVDIKKLVELASKGSGALWALMAVATAFGAFVANIKSIVAFFLHP